MKSAPFATKPLKVLPASPYLLLRARVYQPGDDENIRLGIKHQEMMEVSCGHGQFQRYQAPNHKCYVCCLALMEGKNRRMFEGKYANACWKYALEAIINWLLLYYYISLFMIIVYYPC